MKWIGARIDMIFLFIQVSIFHWTIRCLLVLWGKNVRKFIYLLIVDSPNINTKEADKLKFHKFWILFRFLKSNSVWINLFDFRFWVKKFQSPQKSYNFLCVWIETERCTVNYIIIITMVHHHYYLTALSNWWLFHTPNFIITDHHCKSKYNYCLLFFFSYHFLSLFAQFLHFFLYLSIGLYQQQ